MTPAKQVSCSQCGTYFDRTAVAQKMCSDECRADRRRRSAVVPVAVRQVLGARVRVAGDKALGRTTPDWIVRLSETDIPR